MLNIKQGEHQIKYWSILVLYELNRKLNSKKVILRDKIKIQSQRSCVRRNEYERKYTNELKSYISNFINKPSLQAIKLFFFLQYRKYDIAVRQQESQSNLYLIHLVIFLYDSISLPTVSTTTAPKAVRASLRYPQQLNPKSLLQLKIGAGFQKDSSSLRRNSCRKRQRLTRQRE